jgi:hypothetical protein
MSSRLVTTLVLGAALALGGCGILKKKSADAEPAPSVAAAPSVAPAPVAPAPAPAPEPAPVAAAEPPIDEASVPAPQDFEDEAFEKVTQANFKAELTRLSKEISAPPAK